MGALFYSRWICLFLLISHYVVGQDYRERRQVPLNLNANPNSNVPRLQSQPNSFISMNNNPPFIAQNRNPQYGLVNENGAFLAASNNAMYGPGNNQDARPMSPNNNVAALPSSINVGRFGPTNNLVPLAQSNQNMNPQMMPANNLHAIASNQQSNQNMMMANEHLLAASQSQIDPSRSRGYYNNPPFQPNPFGEQKPAGWFGTNHMNWLSHQESELDKNKLAAAKYPAQNSAGGPPPPANPLLPKREDGGPGLLAKVAKQYATKGQKSFNFGPYETLQGRGAVCTNMENFDGFVYGRFPCPLPASTGMSQLDVFCCGSTNYQYCCNQQEFSQFQRGAGGNSLYMGDQTFPKRATYPTSTKKMLAIMLPMAGVLVLGGIVALVFIFYKKFRHEQYRIRKLPGTMRLQENYSILPQDALADRSIYEPDGHPQMNSQA